MRIASRAAIAAIAAILLTAAGPAYAGPLDVGGEWYTEDRLGVIRMAPCAGNAAAPLCGFVVGISDWPANGDVLRDIHGTPRCHLAIIRGMHPGDDARLHGTVTNPEDGQIYSAELWVGADGVLRLRGYIGISLFGSTQHWPRFAGSVQPDCHFKPSAG